MRIIDGNGRLREMRELVREYVAKLGRDLTFQGIEAELADLSGKYAPPSGRTLVAVDGSDRVVGCVAYHRLTDVRCELKRLYVRPAARGRHVGRALVTRMLAVARADGFKEMVLDTFSDLASAVHLYHALGFRECEAYYENPLSGALYMRRDL